MAVPPTAFKRRLLGWDHGKFDRRIELRGRLPALSQAVRGRAARLVRHRGPGWVQVPALPTLRAVRARRRLDQRLTRETTSPAKRAAPAARATRQARRARTRARRSCRS